MSLRMATFLAVVFSFATASAQVLINGVITGYDGKPLATAEVKLANAANEEIDVATANTDGKFEVRSPHTGLMKLQLAGPLHRQSEALIYTDSAGTISIDARLTAPTYSGGPLELRLSTSDAKSPLNNTPFVRQPDGTFVAEIETQQPELLLAINGLVKNGPPLAVPGAEEYRCLSNLHCYAVAHPAGGKFRVVFDPKLLVRTVEPFRVTYRDPGSSSAIAGSILDRAEEFNGRMRIAQQERALQSGKAINQTPLEPPPSARVSQVIQEIDQERVPMVRQARLFEYLLLVFMNAPADPALVRRAIDELTPASALWPLNVGNVAGSAIFATGTPEKYVDYAVKILEAQPSKALKAASVAGIIGEFGRHGLGTAAAPLMSKAKTEAGDLPILKMVLAEYGIERKVQKGKQVPPFHAPSLNDPSISYTETSLKGKVYLIDFWATWCMPCVTEFPNLTRLYEEYRSRGFEVLSYSIDSNAELVREFRKNHFAMPWLHAIDPQFRELQSPMAKDFEVISIPRPVLIDSKGMVVGTDEDCRGSKLEALLQRLVPPEPVVAQTK